MKTNRQPKTIDAAVDAVLRELTTGKREELATLAEDELDGLFYTLGATIRNSLALSTGNRELLDDAGADDADTASQVIMHALWQRLRDEADKPLTE